MSTTTTDATAQRTRLEVKAEQLSSLLCILRGEGGESFRTYSDEIQENVLWLASDLADEVRELACAVDTANGGAA